VLQHGDDDLSLVLVAIGKERADRTVDEARDQGLGFGRAAFALEVATRDLAGGEVLFLVVDGQGEEILARLRLLGRHDGGEHHGLAERREHGAVGLAGDLAGFEGQRLAAPAELDFMVVEFDGHCLVFPFCRKSGNAGGVAKPRELIRCASEPGTPCARPAQNRHGSSADAVPDAPGSVIGAGIVMRHPVVGRGGPWTRR